MRRSRAVEQLRFGEAGDEPEEESATPLGPTATRLAPSDRALRIAEFYERLDGALRSAFPAELWVTGEIRSLRESKGHRFIELADEGPSPRIESGVTIAAGTPRLAARPPAQSLEVACWAREWPAIERALSEAGITLQEGLVVRIKGRVSIYEAGGRIRFTMTALDVEALLGGIAAARRRLLQCLAAEDLLFANARLPVPLVPLRIGVVTSAGSEAYRDFTGQLARSGFAFEVRLEHSLVQGNEAPTQLAAALGRLALFAPDLAVVVRGGGGKGDLACFDSETVARAIATAPFPIWTGIGHTGDRAVADEVAAASFITPSACGEAVVDVVARYLDGIYQRAATLSSLASARLDATLVDLNGRARAVGMIARHQLDRRTDEALRTAGRLESAATGGIGRTLHALERAAGGLGEAVSRSLESLAHTLRSQAAVMRAYDPARQLERGWSLTHDETGRLLRSVTNVERGTTLTTRLTDGQLLSVVHATVARGESPPDGEPRPSSKQEHGRDYRRPMGDGDDAERDRRAGGRDE